MSNQPTTTFEAKVFREIKNGMGVSQHIEVASTGEVTVLFHPGMRETDDKISGPGIVVQFPIFGPRTFTLTCERSQVINALEQFYANDLKYDDTLKVFVQEVLQICKHTLQP